MKSILKSLSIVLLLISQTLNANSSSDEDKFEWLTKIGGTIIIDGEINEEIWSEITPLPLTMYLPNNGSTPSEKTEIKLAYDDEYIYVSANMFISNKNLIRINSYERDVPTSGSEFNFFFTSDYQNSEGFSINPAGRRVDAQILCNTNCNDWFNVDWNIIWYAKSKITDNGWSVEAKIPISSLNFTIEEDHLTFGFIAHRLIGAKNERQTFPAISQKWPNGPFRASLAHKFSIENVKQKKPIYITPYLLGKYEKVNENSGKIKGGFGVDVKYKLTNSSTIDLTYNTDFSQVEADDQQTNLTQFSLLFPEKRQFFQERSGIFNFNTGGNEKLFNSRSIGLTTTGEPVKILGGLRLVSQIKNWDIGVLNMQTEQTTEFNPENFGVFRVKKNKPNSFTYYGAMITSRISKNGYYNYNIGLDAVTLVSESDALILKVINTLENNTNFGLQSTFFSMDWVRPRDLKLGYKFSLQHRGKNYNPAVGYLTRKDHISINKKISYYWSINENSKIKRHGPTLLNNSIWNYSRDLIEYNYSKINWMIETKSENILNASLFSEYQDINAPFTISNNVEIPIGKYSNKGVLLKYNMSERNLLRTDVSFSARELYDGKGFDFSISPTWIFSKNLEISAGIQLIKYDFNKRNQELKSIISRLKTRYSLNSKLSINLFVQYNSDTKWFGINTRARYNFGDGHDFYLVYNESRTSNYNDQFGNTTDLINQGLYLKYTYTFIK